MQRALVAGIVLGASAAAASPRTAQLGITGDACRADDLVARVRELVARDPFAPGAALRIGVAFQAGPQATVTIAGRGERALTAPSCGELIDAIALVISIDVAGDEPPPAARPVRISDAEEPVAPRIVIRSGVGVPVQHATMMLAGLGATTHGTPVGSIGARLRAGRWSFEGALELAGPEAYPMIRVMRGGATFAGCAHLGPASACPTATIGWVTGTGRDLVIADTATTLAAAVGARLAVEHRLVGGVGVRARLDERVSLTSTAFTVDGRAVWDTPRTELAFGIDVIAQIP